MMPIVLGALVNMIGAAHICPLNEHKNLHPDNEYDNSYKLRKL